MTNIRTTTIQKAHCYLRMLALVAALAIAAGLLVASTAGPAYAVGTTFTVNSVSDLDDVSAGDSICDATATPEVTCTLRAAIHETNANLGADVIEFSIPSNAICDAATDVCTIRPNSELPPILHQVTIDGYSQPGASQNTRAVGDNASLKIELDGSNTGFDNGLVIDGASNSVIRGLVINRFQNAGIEIDGASAVGNRIEGNFIGTDPSGALDKGNSIDGVDVVDGPSKTVVGGSTPEKRNLISGNVASGVFIEFADNNRVQGNYLGTDRSGTKDLGNDAQGVFVAGSSSTMVGGTTAASRNIISGNRSGIEMQTSKGTMVLGNRIGTTAGGTSALGNTEEGVFVIDGSANNRIGDGTAAGSNTIAFNGLDGVQVDRTSTGNSVSRNALFSNAGLGIDLLGPGEGEFTDVPAANDSGDTDTGANRLQNRPIVSSAKIASGKATIKGKLVSTPNRTFTIQLFANPKGLDEGKTFIGQKSVTTGGSGSVSFSLSTSKVAVGQTITAAATRDSTGDTSEFSLPKTVATS